MKVGTDGIWPKSLLCSRYGNVIVKAAAAMAYIKDKSPLLRVEPIGLQLTGLIQSSFFGSMTGIRPAIHMGENIARSQDLKKQPFQWKYRFCTAQVNHHRNAAGPLSSLHCPSVGFPVVVLEMRHFYAHNLWKLPGHKSCHLGIHVIDILFMRHHAPHSFTHNIY